MSRFFINLIYFLALLAAIFISLHLLFTGSMSFSSGFELTDDFKKKSKLFKKFYKQNKSINLILGSSMIEDSIIPDSLGKNWFSFTNEGQNIYNSYSFLKFYIDSIKIDTIIIGIQPFDFPFSYAKSKDRAKIPPNNSNFYIFGSDSINKRLLKSEFQKYKESYYPKLNYYFSNRTKIISPNKILTMQGYSGKINYPIIDIDSLYRAKTIDERNAYKYYNNVSNTPNMKFFDLFHNLMLPRMIKLIYLIPPKAKFYHYDEKELKYDEVWNTIINKLKERNVELWDYSHIEENLLDIIWFRDETHLTYQGAIRFTEIIKNRLKK